MQGGILAVLREDAQINLATNTAITMHTAKTKNFDVRDILE